MSTVRRQGSRFLGKGPNGRNLCFCGCAREVVRPRLNWFSDQCVNDWRDRNDPVRIRSRVLERDRGICAHCQKDCVTAELLAQESGGLWRWLAKKECANMEWTESWSFIDGYVRIRRREIGVAHDGHAWEADHIVPVIEGGGLCGLENYRTLCLTCHRKETAALARRRAEKRRCTKSSPLTRAQP